jgi:hypothetical protein
MLDHHPDLAVTNDTHFIADTFHEVLHAGDPPLTPDVLEVVRSHPWFKRLRLPDFRVAAAATGAATYGEFVSRLYTQLARSRGKELAGDKTPDYVCHMGLLGRLFPWAKFVHVVRDGRDVALSARGWAQNEERGQVGPARFVLWDEEPVAVTALWWQWMVSQGLRDGAAHAPDRYFQVRYEAVASRPGEALADILGFLELPFSGRALAYHRTTPPPALGYGSNSAWLPPTPGLRDWRSEMPPRDVELFEALAGDLLTELGDEVLHHRISASVATVADRCRQWWGTDRRTRRSASTAEVMAPPGA